MKSILFVEDMFNAVINGQKTMTRRLSGLDRINTFPDVWIFNNITYRPKNESYHLINRENVHKNVTVAKGTYATFDATNKDDCRNFLEEFTSAKSRLNIGEILYLKEPYHMFPDTGKILYKFDIVPHQRDNYHWNNKLFMPQKAARYFVKITDIRCERLQDITKEDAIKEGVLRVRHDLNVEAYKDYESKKNLPSDFFCNPKNSFQTLWRSINGKGSWEKNPHVFVYCFEITNP